MTESPSPFNKELLDRLTTGISKSLEKRPGVCDIELTRKPQVLRHQLSSWEQRNSVLLPEDFKNLYQMTDGMLLQWSVKLDGDNTQPLGRMELNSLADVTKIAGEKITRRNNPTLADLDDDSDGEQETDETPSFGPTSRIFELDPCQGSGKVCLVYRNTKPGRPAEDAEIWFLDTALRWHFLSSTFAQYFRLMMVHLGLPQWQYAFTDVGLSPSARQWFNLYGPYRLQTDSILTEMFGPDEEAECAIPDGVPLQKLDATRVFKGKSEKKSKASSGQLKKKSAQNKPMSGGLSGRSTQFQGSSRFR
ncbi:tubulin polyglutamylase complex subunit 2 [Strongylocentrotus purpuratus]|uniref:Knr4/Smi1-like domain-containing protein n=1 Tax=Strongylocentrotus purpuratus TaxID=7668 RepID=A0A7M7N968_STRPU|nr:tubulin polyglutamylase complex subunit 2 [Strongylocentrotus purpuratus]